MDYSFYSQDDEKASRNPIFNMSHSKHRSVFSRAVGEKGLGEGHHMDWLIKSVVEEIDDLWGHRGSEVILKCDQEHSIEAVRREISGLRVGESIMKHAPKGESQSNGRVEEAGKTVRNLVLAYKLQIEKNANIKLESDSPIMQWGVRLAAINQTRYAVGIDGKTAYERLKGKRCKAEGCHLGECVWYKEFEGWSPARQQNG